MLADAVTRAARVMPVVVVTGARQTGKSTLEWLGARVLAAPWWRLL